MSDLKELIERELESFIEWDGDDKSIVTTTSAKLFAEHVAGLWADHVAGARKMVAAVQGEPEYGSTPQYINDAIDNLAHDNYELSYSGYQARTRDVELIRAYLARAPQPAEQQPDVARLVEALEASQHGLHDSIDGEECQCSQCKFVRLRDAALAPYRKGGEQ